MNSRFGGFYSIAALLAAPLLGAVMPCHAQGDLELELVGPFAVCEEAANLRIWIPKLDSTHFVPGFRAGSSELPLGDVGNPTQYPPFNVVSPVPQGSTPTQYEVKIRRSNRNAIQGAMNIMLPQSVPSTGPRRIAIYGENGPFNCAVDKVDKNLASVSIIVPKPDEIWPDAPAAETELVSSGGIAKGQCPGPSGCRYATRATLRYLDVDLATSTIFEVGSRAGWSPDVSPVGSKARITLQVVPVPEQNGNAHQQSADAFKQMTTMIGIPRDLSYPPSGSAANLDEKNSGINHLHMQPVNYVMFSSTTAKDCHAPVMLVCTSTPKACQ
jgi:hypothetical protein